LAVLETTNAVGFHETACGQMALTSRGVAQMFLLGQRLRQRYVDQLGFLSAGFEPAEYYVRSTDTQRTIMTAQAVLIGLLPDALGAHHTTRLLPPRSETPDPHELPAVATAFGIPIHIFKDSEENMYPSYRNCRRWYQERMKLRPAFRELDRVQHAGIRQQLSACFDQLNLGRGYQSIANLFATMVAEHPTHLCDTLRARYPHVFSFCRQVPPAESVLPPCLTAALYEEIQAASGFELAHKFHTPQLARLAIGGFIADIFADLQAKVQHPTSPRKLSLYAGHDSTLAPFLAAYQVFDNYLPPLGSHLLIELYHNPQDDSHAVRLIYNDQVMPLPAVVDRELAPTAPLPIPGAIRWTDFCALTQRVASTDRVAECQPLPDDPLDS
jgi:hypothetical protein